MRRFCILVFLLVTPCLLAEQPDLNVVLMQNTFLLSGSSGTPGLNTFGTGFILVRPFASQPNDKQIEGKAVLVTAAHVFDGMKGDDAIIVLRTQQSGTEKWSIVPARFHIRHGGQPLWTKNPTADVAVMYVAWPLPGPAVVVPTTVLADDAMIRADEVNPGAEMKILGYPMGNVGNDAGFPILRTGVVASYPLLPTADTKTFLLDFRVLKGNSGGPVYFSQRPIKGGGVVCCGPQFIMGLVSQEKLLETPYSQFQLSLGEIIHASIIKATIDLLPAPETHEADLMVVPLELMPQH